MALRSRCARAAPARRESARPAPMAAPRATSTRPLARPFHVAQVLSADGSQGLVQNARLREVAPQLLLDYYEAVIKFAT